MDWNSRAREVLLAYASIDNSELGEDKFMGHHDLDQALSELASIVEEEIRNGQERALRSVYSRLDEVFPGFKAEGEKHIAEDLDQLSNRRNA